jgi:hypothetical protein
MTDNHAVLIIEILRQIEARLAAIAGELFKLAHR